MNKRLIYGLVLASAFLFQVGCANNNAINEENMNTEITDSKNSQDKELMQQFNKIVVTSEGTEDILDFIDKNIANVTKESGTIMLDMMESKQKDYESKIQTIVEEQKFQEALLREKKNIDEINENKSLKDPYVIETVNKVKDAGFKLDTSEGMYYTVVDYKTYGRYAENVTEEMKEYINIMATESEKAPAKDAAIVIGWDEVLNRAIAQERYITNYPKSRKINNINELYRKYTSFIAYGANNTPLFDYNTKEMVNDAKLVYLKVAESKENTKLIEKIKGFVEVLQNNKFKLTREVETYRGEMANDLISQKE